MMFRVENTQQPQCDEVVRTLPIVFGLVRAPQQAADGQTPPRHRIVHRDDACNEREARVLSLCLKGNNVQPDNMFEIISRFRAVP